MEMFCASHAKQIPLRRLITAAALRYMQHSSGYEHRTVDVTAVTFSGDLKAK